MKKTEALKRLDAIEKESKELRLIIEAPDKPDWISLFREFCDENGLLFSDIVPNDNPKTRKQEANIAHAMLMEIVEVVNRKDNGGKTWVPDYNDGKYKYIPVFDLSASGFGFSATNFDRWYSNTFAGSRLQFLKEASVKPTALKYLPIYEKYEKY